MCTTNNSPNFIKKSYPKDKVYSVWLYQLNLLEKSTITTSSTNTDDNFDKSMDIVYKLFPIIDSISLTLFGSLTGRKYLQNLGYSKKEAHLIYSIFRNGIMHTLSPYELKYKNGTISWGMMSSSGTNGFTPHYPGYKDPINSEFDEPADKAFECVKLGKNTFHASLSIDELVAQIKYDLTEKQKNDKRKKISIVTGEKIDSRI